MTQQSDMTACSTVSTRVRFVLLLLTSIAATLAVAPAYADLRRLDAYTGGEIHGIKITALHRNVSQVGFVAAVKETDGRTALIGFTARNDGLTRLAHNRTPGPNPGSFDVAAANGMVVSAQADTQGNLLLYSWDATSIKPVAPKHEIRRLAHYKLGRYHSQVSIAYLYPIASFYRFAVFLLDSNFEEKLIIFDVHETTGEFVRRGSASGFHMWNVHSLAMVDHNVVDTSKPTRLATTSTSPQGLWVRLWNVDRNGNVSIGNAATGGQADDPQIARVDDRFFVVFLGQDDRRVKIITFRLQPNGTLQRGGEAILDEANNEPTPKLGACTPGGGSGQYLAVRDRSQELSLYDLSFPAPNWIQNRGVNRESGWVHDIDCAEVAAYVVAAVKNAQNKWMVIQFRK